MANYLSKHTVGGSKSDITGGAWVLPNVKSTGSSKSKSGGGSSGGGGGGASYSAPAIDYQAELQRLIGELYEDTFSSEPIVYEPLTQDQLAKQVEAWLRPAYDEAIAGRAKQTLRTNAELDADAISRGMGASTFVTDVKGRNLRSEAEDIALLESEYGATLARNVSELLGQEKDRALETDMFNKEQEQFEYELAYDAATLLLSTMGGGGGGGGRGGRSRRKSYRSGYSKTKTTTWKNCESLLSTMSSAERANLYAGSTAESAACRSEIIASVGLSGYYELQSQYR